MLKRVIVSALLFVMAAYVAKVVSQFAILNQPKQAQPAHGPERRTAKLESRQRTESLASPLLVERSKKARQDLHGETRSSQSLVPIDYKRLEKGESRDAIRQNIQGDFLLNGKPANWLRHLHAVRSNAGRGASAKGLPSGNEHNGYLILEGPPIQRTFGDTHADSLFVVEVGHERRIISGLITVSLQGVTPPEDLASRHHLRLVYFAPSIGTALFRPEDGANLLDTVAALQAEPSIKEARIELLGEGVRPQ